MTEVSEVWGLGRRMALAQRRSDRQVEEVIQRLRLVSVVPAVAQLLVYPGSIHWPAVVAVMVLVLNCLWVWLMLRSEDLGSPRRSLGWTSIFGDVATALLLMANYRLNPADSVQFLPLIMVVQAAARWGRTGGLIGGITAGLVSSGWAVGVHRNLGLELPGMTLAFRVVIFGLVGLFVGLMVREARQQRRAAESVINASRDLVVTFSVDGTVRSVNPACQRILGYSPEELVGRDRSSLLAPGERTFGPVATDLYRREGPQLVELRLLHRDGGVVWLEFDLLPDLEAGVVHALGRDVGVRRQAESELRRRADHDGLTGVLNRQALFAHLRGRFTLDMLPGLVFIDLDRFKSINDGHGHLTGDRVLKEIAERLTGVIDGQGRVARYAGDEFCLAVDNPAHLEAVVDRVRAVLQAPLSLGGKNLLVTASLGWAHSTPGDGPEELLDRADQAMYSAKAAGRP